MIRLPAMNRSANGTFLAKPSAIEHNLRSGKNNKYPSMQVCASRSIPFRVRRKLETELSARCTALHEQGATVDGQPPETDVRSSTERLLRALLAMTSAEAATVHSRSGAGEAMELVAAVGVGAERCDRIVKTPPVGNECSDAAGEAAACIARPIFHRVRESPGQGSESRLVAAVPLHSRGEVCGVLSLLFTPDVDEAALPAAVGELLPALGEVLGLALENALLSEADFHAGLMLQRQLIANEVHDSLAQNLASVRMRTALLRDAVAKRDASRMANYLAEIDESLALAQSRVREIITDFRSQMGTTQLVPALESAIDELRTASGVQIDFDSGGHEPQLSAFEQVQIFYIAREALTNALKHARASCVRIALEQVDEHFELRVEDNGVGLHRSRSLDTGHFGLDIMRERAARLGGAVAFEVARGGGTRVRLRFASRVALGEVGA